MRNFLVVFIMLCLVACKDYEEDIRGIPGPAEVEAATEEIPDVEEQSRLLQEEGYQTFLYEEADTSHLMQQYFIAFLKRGPNREQDSVTAAKLQEKHLEHLSRLSREGYTSLTGPMGDDGEVRGIVVFNTPTLEMADGLARLDPIVEVGRLEVEVRPWWAAKGAKLK